MVRAALTGAAAALLSACSTSERLSDPWSNPFQSSANGGGQAAAPGPVAAAPVSPVQSRPLGAPLASANPSSPPSPRLAAAPSHTGQGVAGWSAQGGSPIVVAQGENAQILSSRYGVPAEALVRTNGFASEAQIRPGTRIVIPVYNAALAASAGVHAAASAAPKAAAQAKPSPLAPRTLASQAQASQAQAIRSATAHAPKPGTAEPVATLAQKSAEKPPLAAAQKHAAVAAAPLPAAGAAKPAMPQTAKAEKPEDSKAPARDQAPPAAAEPVKASAAASEAANPEFRWPARGRIIQGFKPGGNDGINIALPEGTSVKAAESGVVAYAGNELKGYGNLVLIRHPNGFVSAYANTGEIDVKRGETVKRGQTIAKSGQSGNVSTPQLHFELRKGTTPVDPTQYLAGA